MNATLRPWTYYPMAVMLLLSNLLATRVNFPLTSSPETRAAFDEWLWTLDEDALDRLRLPKLGKAAAAAKVALPQLTFLTVITGSSQPAFKSLLHAAGARRAPHGRPKPGG